MHKECLRAIGQIGRNEYNRRSSAFSALMHPHSYTNKIIFTKGKYKKHLNFYHFNNGLRCTLFYCLLLVNRQTMLNPITTKARWGLPTSHFPLPTSHFRLPTSYFSLPTSHFLLLTSHFQLPTSHFPLPTSHFPLPTSHFPLPTSRLQLLGAHVVNSLGW